VTDRPRKAEERSVARLLGGQRHWANSGRRVDVESPGYVCQVKHRRGCSLAELERLAVELEQLSEQQGKVKARRRQAPGGAGAGDTAFSCDGGAGYGGGWCSNSNLSLHATRSSLERGTLWIEKGTLWIGY
jgi:hypothetical protein